MKKALYSAFLAIGFTSAAWAAPSITGIGLRQHWPFSTEATIEYVLSGASAETPVHVTFTARSGGRDLFTIPEAALSGKRFGLTQSGTYRVTFNPAKTAYASLGLVPDFSIRADVSTNSGDFYSEVIYKICDLGDNTVTDVTRGDLMNGTYGSYSTNLEWISNSWVKTNGTAIVWTGVTNDAYYATNAIVLRKIPKGSFAMSSTLTVNITNDCWVGVFEVTQAQWKNIMAGSGKESPSKFSIDGDCRPVEQISYAQIRESTNSQWLACANYGWPTNSTVNNPIVSDFSFMGRMRKRFASSGLNFDLPTEAQWEYASMAGTLISKWNDGSAYVSYSGIDTNLDCLGRYYFNGGYCSSDQVNYSFPGNNVGPTNATAKVGSYRPNAWGLYDIHGNVYEKCLDNYPPQDLTGVVDNPAGPLSGGQEQRICKGGSFVNVPSSCFVGFRSAYKTVTDASPYSYGFRIFVATVRQ